MTAKGRCPDSSSLRRANESSGCCSLCATYRPLPAISLPSASSAARPEGSCVQPALPAIRRSKQQRDFLIVEPERQEFHPGVCIGASHYRASLPFGCSKPLKRCIFLRHRTSPDKAALVSLL